MHRVLVVGQRRLFVDLLVAAISSTAGWSAYSAAPTGSAAHPGDEPVDVLLVADGRQESAQRLVADVRAQWPATPVVFISTATDGDAGEGLDWRAGPRELIAALKDALANDAAPPAVPRTDVAALRASLDLSDGDRLTARQLEILRLLASGQGADQVAAHLGISRHTLRTHLHNIMARLGAHSRLELLARARHLGLLAGAGGGTTTLQ